MKTCNVCEERPAFKGKARCQICETRINRERRQAKPPEEHKRKPIGHEERIQAYIEREWERTK